MRVLVCGGRDYNDVFRVCRKLDELHARTPFEVVIHGGARGADRLADIWAKCQGPETGGRLGEGIPREVYPADWDKHKKAAGALRNQQMLDEGKPDLVVVFPGGRGTEDMVRRAYRARIPVMEITVGPTVGPQDEQTSETG
jgi:predicted Rossmann-fold nucleotide-binding protein